MHWHSQPHRTARVGRRARTAKQEQNRRRGSTAARADRGIGGTLGSEGTGGAEATQTVHCTGTLATQPAFVRRVVSRDQSICLFGVTTAEGRIEIYGATRSRFPYSQCIHVGISLILDVLSKLGPLDANAIEREDNEVWTLEFRSVPRSALGVGAFPGNRCKDSEGNQT